ncbi:APC family permease [Arthrobacter sp. H35-D1]|uniref:APC family permease n=1 Tax=Arthrobacter sp. H35-D1 TaxID=3046202 RepID=UPI0024BB14C2|nr:APC family permease [Arthrobacter sp. H35-D1]MDJ0313298.1 APC family permease [Arthrobacter sp. H35-D1]
MSNAPELSRRLGTFDASVIGVGSMLGAGVFAAFTPAAAAAGSGLLIGLLIAGVVAFCNATSSAQLAAVYPSSGGTYVYGRERLGPWAGYLAGWGFVIGKTASAAAMAMTFAAYAAPAGWERPVAIGAVVVLAAVNYHGVTRTAGLIRILVVLVLLALGAAVAVVWGGQGAEPSRILGDGLFAHGWYGILQSAGLLFFAFAGYARIATLGGEVRNPKRTIPRAIILALSVAVVVYVVIAITLLAALGPEAVARTATPLADAASSVAAWAGPVVKVGAAVAALGALLGLLAGLGRTTLAMARGGDLPQWLDAVHPRYHVPHRAELAFAAVICVVILVADLRGAIGFSSFGVLLYYLVANLAAFTQPPADRRYPKGFQVLGALACVGLVVTLPPLSVVLGVLVFAAGIALRLIRTGRRRP